MFFLSHVTLIPKKNTTQKFSEKKSSGPFPQGPNPPNLTPSLTFTPPTNGDDQWTSVLEVSTDNENLAMFVLRLGFSDIFWWWIGHWKIEAFPIGILEISVAGPFFPRFWQFGILETKMLLGNSGPFSKVGMVIFNDPE